LPLSACCCFSAQEIRELWMEYEENASLEAKVVKDFDKVQFHISIHQVGGMMATSN
jgi:5'-deoxynucleotidase YfbR-like HD superfamily hydrolase